VRRFSLLEYAVLAAYLLLVAAVGASFYRRKATTRDYFLGGRSMSWLPVGISIVAADLSAITLMGVPGWAFHNDLQLCWTFFGMLLAAAPMIWIFIPFYCSLHLYTAYEYLERRFNIVVRLVASALFQFLRLVHVAIALYGPSLALNLVTGLPVAQCVLMIGALTSIYTSFGGVKAVIWTDVIQFTTICSGVGLMFWAALRQIDGGLPAVATLAHDAGRLTIWNPTLNPSEPLAFWPCLLGGGMLSFSALATDQALLQRLFTTKSRRDATRSIVANAVLTVPLLWLLSALGIVLFAFYRQHPDEIKSLPTADAILPYFAVQHLPRAMSALVIAAIFAASMAVMSAGINALSTAATADFYRRLVRPASTPEDYVRFGRAATAAWGVLATVLALFMGRLNSLVLAYAKVSSLVAGPMLGIFLLGMLTRRATSGGTLAGAAVGALVLAAVASLTPISFYYHALIGAAVTIMAGWLASWLTAPPAPAQIEGLVLAAALEE
jgi:solute:Na+ symporter, SSS family